MTPNHKVLFGLGLENEVHQVGEMLAHARVADEAGLDFVSVNDHPYFANRLDAYAALGFVLGATSNVSGAVIMTNLLSRPAPILARTVTGLSDVSGGRVILGIGAGGIEEEIAALGVPRLSPGARIRALEEAIKVVRDVGTIYIVPGAITRNPLPETRDEDGRWIGGGVTQWVEELTSAVL